jgi:NAD(P)-dependent dehydrogenase (short-subunit alcohol dehydrogenase family)
MENPISLSRKTILITGASSGIGKCIAIMTSKMEAKVIITARREEMLKETLVEMHDNENSYVVADLSMQEDIDTLVDQLPKLDGIVHCAGVGSRQLCKFVTREELDRVIGANFIAPVMLQTAILAKKKINKGGSIVFIASHGAAVPTVANSIYSASKAAIISYANCLALEVAQREIRVNCISPGMVWTDLIVRDGLDEETLKENEKTYPLGRYGKPEDIAPLVVYLLSDVSQWMTTTNIKISGGN